MNEEEFLSMISDEIARLESESKKIHRELNYGVKVDAEKQFNGMLIGIKLASLRDLVNLPRYARIQAMSDVEIEEYKRQKVDELNKIIHSIKHEQMDLCIRIRYLNDELQRKEEIINNGSDDAREDAVSSYETISNNKKDIMEQIESMTRKIENIEIKIEQVKLATSSEIKSKLLSEIEDVATLDKAIKDASSGVDLAIELYSSAVQSSESIVKMAQLMKDYSKLRSASRGAIQLRYSLPKPLRDELVENAECYPNTSITTISADDPDKLMGIIERFEESFNSAKDFFNEYYTEQKLLGLVEKFGIFYKNGSISSAVDMNFLKLHVDKLRDGELDLLQSLVDRKNGFSDKDIIDWLDEIIKSEQLMIYNAIGQWYLNGSGAAIFNEQRPILNIDKGYDMDFYSEAGLRRMLIDFKDRIALSEREIAALKAKVQEVQREREKQLQELEEVANKIRSYGDERYSDALILFTSFRIEENRMMILKSFRTVYEREIVISVIQEAQRQADLKEAELREVSIDSLLNSKVK